MNTWLDRHRTSLLLAIGLAIVGSGLAVVLRWQRPATIEIIPPPPSPTPPATTTPAPLTVYVSGAVSAPDVYTLPPGSIVRDAILMAGGPTGEADLNAINLARSLQDQQQVYVPVEGEAPLPISGDGQPAISGPININSASAAQLETLPGIGPSLAQAIIEYREANGPFTDTAQLENVPGIGPSKLEAIQTLIITG